MVEESFLSAGGNGSCNGVDHMNMVSVHHDTRMGQGRGSEATGFVFLPISKKASS